MAEFDPWGNYHKGQQAVLAPQLAQLQQMTGAVGLAGHLAQMQRESAMRTELAALGPNPSQEALAGIASKYAPAGDILKSQTSSLDRKAALTATMAQKASLAEMTHQIRMAGLKSKEERDAEIARHNLVKEGLNREAQAMTGQRLFYDTGMQPATSAMPAPAPAPAAAPPQGNVTIAPTVSPAEAMAIQNPQDRAQAMGALQAGRFSDPTQSPAVVPQPPVAAPIAPATAAPPMPAGPTGNMDMRDVQARLASQLGPQPAPIPISSAVKPAAPSVPGMPPEIAGAPLSVQNKWKLQQTRTVNQIGALVTPENANLHGEQFLSTLPPDKQNIVKAVVSYEAPMTTFSMRTGGERAAILAAAKQADPNFNVMKYPVRQKIVSDFTSGPTANNIVALDQAINHMGTLWKLGDALQNNDVKALNAAVNFARDQTGDPRVNNFSTAKQAVGTELMRVFRQVQASEIETQAWEKRFSDANSPEQIKGAIQIGAKLLEGRINAINNRWNRGMETNTGYPQILSPEAKNALNMFMGNSNRRASDNTTGWKIEKVSP